MTNKLRLTPPEEARVLMAQRRRAIESERRLVCPMIRTSIDDGQESIKSYKEIEDKIAPIVNELEAEQPGTGISIIKDMERIIKEKQNHDTALKNMSLIFKCPSLSLR